jgi:hypothetical protein
MIAAPPAWLGRDARRSRIRNAVVLGLVIGGALAVDPSRPLPVELCAFKWLTGWSCPTCGLTRAFCHALRGNLAASVAFHPLGPLAALTAVSWAVGAALEAWRGRKLGATAQTLVRLGIVRAVRLTLTRMPPRGSSLASA